jgi:hypothetical protein
MAKSIEQEIADLEKAINSPATPEAQKGVMKGILEKLKAKQSSAPKKSNEPIDLSTQKGRNEYAEKISKVPAKKSETGKLMVAEVVYRDASNYKDNYLFGILPEYVNDVKEGDEEVPVGYFGITNEQWEEFGRDWNDEFDHYLLEVMKVYPYENDEMIDNSSELAVNSVKWNEALKGTKKGKKIEPKTESKKPTSEDDYDCDTLIEKEKTRRAKIKERALKKANAPKPTQATKNRDAIEKVGDKLEASIEKRLETGKVSKNELTKLIDETKALLKMLESYLDKVN